MRIAVLCRNLHTAGGYVIGINFVRTLAKVAQEHQFLIVAPPNIGYEQLELPKGSKVHLYEGGVGTFNQLKFDCWQMPRVIKEFRPEIILGLGNFGITNPPCKQAILFHKSHLIYPYKHYSKEILRSKVRNYFLKLRMMQCLKYTDLVFCQTPITQRRFAITFKYPIDKIKIMPNAVSEFIKISPEKASVPKVLEDREKFNLFFLSKFYAHKNFEVLIKLFRNYPRELHDVRCIVTISEDQHDNAPKFLSDIRRYKLQDHIINVGPLTQTELMNYYYNCDALFFPTLLESFSGTYLEAMYFGLPILTSNLDFAQYVCGDSAVFFDPWDLKDISDKILLLKSDADLRVKLIKRGKERISRFYKSWEEIVHDVMVELGTLVRK